MANTVIQLKYSSTPSAIPASLANGEIALNYADGKFYYKNATGQIVSFSGSGNVYSFATINANNSLITALSNNSVLSIVPGQNIGITSDIINDIITISANLKPAYDVANAAFNTANSVSAGNSIPGFNQANQAYLVANSKTFTFMQSSAPATANANDLWANTITGVVYENWGNTTNPIWAEFGPTTVQSGSGTPGVSSFSDITVSGNAAISKRITVNYTPASIVNSAIEISAANTRGGTGYADGIMLTNLSGGATNPNKWIRLGPTGTLEIINSAYNGVPLYMTDGGDLFLTGNLTMSGIQAGYSANRPALRVYGANTTNGLTTTQNGTGQLNNNNWATDYNQGSYLNVSTGTFTAPLAGLYQICLIARNAGNASYSQLACCKNGSSQVLIMIEFGGSSSMNHTGGSTIAKLAAGDTLNIRVLAGTINFDGNDNWSVAYIG